MSKAGGKLARGFEALPEPARQQALAEQLRSPEADTPPLPEDDPLRDWIDRGFDLYGGLGRHPGLKPLFGLEQRDGDPDPFDRTPREFGLNKRNTGPASTSAETAQITGKDKAEADA